MERACGYVGKGNRMMSHLIRSSRPQPPLRHAVALKKRVTHRRPFTFQRDLHLTVTLNTNSRQAHEKALTQNSPEPRIVPPEALDPPLNAHWQKAKPRRLACQSPKS